MQAYITIDYKSLKTLGFHLENAKVFTMELKAEFWCKKITYAIVIVVMKGFKGK